MTSKLFSFVLVTFVFASVGCAGAPSNHPFGSSSTSGSGGAGGMGGEADAGGAGGDGGAQSCVEDSDCTGTIPQSCADAVCTFGVCHDAPWPFGSSCRGSNDPSELCDGRGTCGSWLPYGADHCYEPQPLPWSECPPCDDADPTTADACKMVGGLEQCVHEPLPEGHMCGPWYTIQGGACCPHPDTVTP